MNFKLPVRFWWQFRTLDTLRIFGFLSGARSNFSHSVVQQSNLELSRLYFEDPRSHIINTHTHTHTHTQTTHIHTHTNTWYGLLLTSDQLVTRSRYLHNTKQTQDNNVIALRVIRTHTPSNQAAANLRLRPHDHRDRSKLKLKCIT
jgi:hypothetical protein